MGLGLRLAGTRAMEDMHWGRRSSWVVEDWNVKWTKLRDWGTVLADAGEWEWGEISPEGTGEEDWTSGKDSNNWERVLLVCNIWSQGAGHDW